MLRIRPIVTFRWIRDCWDDSSMSASSRKDDPRAAAIRRGETPGLCCAVCGKILREPVGSFKDRHGAWQNGLCRPCQRVLQASLSVKRPGRC
jgi:hypothetical protein